MRTFIALFVPDSVKQNARMVRNELGKARPDIKWVEYENYHLTVKFIGEVSEKELPAVKRSLSVAAQAVPTINLSAGGIGFFPHKSKPRVVWLGVKGEVDKALFLCERVDTGLAELGYEREKNHSLHLTLGRIRSDTGIKDMLELAQNINQRPRFITFGVNTFYLMRSDLSPAGPRYTVVEKYELNG